MYYSVNPISIMMKIIQSILLILFCTLVFNNVNSTGASIRHSAYNQDYTSYGNYFSIIGKVNDTSGNPLSNATVSVFTNSFEMGTKWCCNVTTKENGAYRIDNLSGFIIGFGWYEACASKTGYHPSDLQKVPQFINNMAVLNFTLTSMNGTLSGRIVDSQGNPIDAELNISSGDSYLLEKTGTGYRFYISLLPGDYSVTLSKDGYDTKVLNVSIFAEQTTDIKNITLIDKQNNNNNNQNSGSINIPFEWVVAVVMLAVIVILIKLYIDKKTKI